MDCESDFHISFNSNLDDSLYISTPEKKIRLENYETQRADNKVCLMETKQLSSFIEQINTIRKCTTPGCKGNLQMLMGKSKGLGGSMIISFELNGFRSVGAAFETSCSLAIRTHAISRIGLAQQIAFIINGCT